MASGGDSKTISREHVREQILRSYAAARRGVLAQTAGQIKLAESRVRAGGLVSDLRSAAVIGVNHKESVAVLAVDMRGSTALAEDNDADKMFVLMQCFIPLLAMITLTLRGEVIGLRGDGLIAAFGFGEPGWRACTNRAYEAGMLMIEASRDELWPFLAAKNVPSPTGIGVGVDCGRVTITKIGLGDAIEVTAYGSAVNKAAKNSKAVDRVWLSSRANRHLHGKDQAESFRPRRGRLA